MKPFTIRYPIIKIAFYGSLSYLGYCAYHYYLEQIKITQITPIILLEEAGSRFEKTLSIEQMLILYKFMYKHIHLRMNYPKNRNQILDCQVSTDKVSSKGWINYYLMKYQVLINQYNKSETTKQGLNAILFWIQVQTKEILKTVQRDKSQNIIRKSLKNRQNKCYQIVYKNNNREETIQNAFIQCLSQTSQIAQSLTRQLYILQQSTNYKSYL